MGVYQWGDGRKFDGQWVTNRMHGKGALAPHPSVCTGPEEHSTVEWSNADSVEQGRRAQGSAGQT